MRVAGGGRGNGELTRAQGDGVDWVGIERSAEVRQLVNRRRRFVVPATIFFLSFSLAYFFLAAYAPDFMGEKVIGVPLAFLLALAQVLMTWVITVLYLRLADRELEPLEQRAAERAVERIGSGR
ncbi:MAG: DUF485 domain-containing protein [Solirubrobacteraceae bacterium]